MELSGIEKELYKQGYRKIACIDEVGRGALAGDVVAAAVIVSGEQVIDGVKDSKKLTPKKREEIHEKTIINSMGIGIGKVSSEIIDNINIKEATIKAMIIAVNSIKDIEGNKIIPDYLLIDAEKIDMEIPSKSIIKGDDKIYGIAVASIVAKVYRDRLCLKWEDEYKGYNFKKNKAYGTKEHREAIVENGICDIHRKSFLKKIVNIKE